MAGRLSRDLADRALKPGDLVRGERNPSYHVPNRPYFDAIEMKGGGDAVSAARAVMELGPRVVVVKQGEYGSAMYTAEGVFGLPAYPTADVVDPTGAGDTFAGVFMGYVAAHPELETQPDPGSYATEYGRYDSVADLLRQIGHDERIHKLDSLVYMGAPRFRPAG